MPITAEERAAIIKEAQAPLLVRLAEYDKPKAKRGKLIRRMLEGIRIPDESKDMIVSAVKANFPLKESGEPNEEALKVLVERELKRHGKLLETLTGRPVNLGTTAAAATVTDPKLIEASDKAHDEAFKETLGGLADLFMDNNEETDTKVAESRRNLFITRGKKVA